MPRTEQIRTLCETIPFQTVRDQHRGARGGAGQNGSGGSTKTQDSGSHEELLQVSVVGLATMIIARDINACEQALWLRPQTCLHSTLLFVEVAGNPGKPVP